MTDGSEGKTSPRALVVASLIVGIVLTASYGGYVVGRDIARTENARHAVEIQAE